MKAYQKTIKYLLSDLNEIEIEIQKQYKDGWLIRIKSDVTKSYLYPDKKEIEIQYLLM